MPLKGVTGAVSKSLKGTQLAEPCAAQRRRGLELCAGPHLRGADGPALAGVLPRADALGARARRAHQPHAGATLNPTKFKMGSTFGRHRNPYEVKMGSMCNQSPSYAHPRALTAPESLGLK